MNKYSKFRIDKGLIIPIIIFAIISLLTISSAEDIILNESNLLLKQGFWYLLGIGIITIILFTKNKFIYENIWILYGLGIVSLILLLIFAHPVNGSKCWFNLGFFTIQPSEFMKIILIITLSKIVSYFHETINKPTLKDEFFLILKIGITTLIPSILTFLQPDTGVVLIYILIMISILFVSGIRLFWFILLGLIIIGTLSFVLLTFFFNENLFINIFGSSFFLRVNRLLDWTNQSGYQLENALTAIGSSGFWGNGYKSIPIYFPEAHTDFIFASFISSFGMIGGAVLLINIIFFNTKLISLTNKASNIDKFIIAGILGMIIYQQIQNISMTIGILPITGITLPFISYGGSSLLSYMIIIGLLLNISNEKHKYKIKY